MTRNLETQIANQGEQQLVIIDEAQELAELNELFQDSAAKNTRKTYTAALNQFRTFCTQRGRDRLPADFETVALFVNAERKTKSLSTLRTYLAAIGDDHRSAGYDDPTKHEAVRKVVKAMARQKRDQGEVQKQARGMIADDVLTILDSLTDSTKDLRDAALITVARAGLTRRSELAALTTDRVNIQAGTFQVYRQKVGRWTDCALTPAAALCLTRWLNHLQTQDIHDGAVFRSIDRHGNIGQGIKGAAIAEIFPALYRRAGLPFHGISGHSARVGSVQDLVAKGESDAAIARDGGWTGPQMIARYGREAKAKQGAVARQLDV